jgi:hypothetical protein
LAIGNWQLAISLHLLPVQPVNKHHPASFQEYSIPRDRMVARLREHYGISDPKVLEAMRSVPRHFFVPEALQSRAYGDHALPISANQTISQPFIVAKMTELLELDANSRVLEIGAGSGYQTAVLSKIGAQVYSIERIGDPSTRGLQRHSEVFRRNARLGRKCALRWHPGGCRWSNYSRATDCATQSGWAIGCTGRRLPRESKIDSCDKDGARAPRRRSRWLRFRPANRPARLVRSLIGAAARFAGSIVIVTRSWGLRPRLYAVTCFAG